jgi:transcriptional regulator with XRE-family HTH domain
MSFFGQKIRQERIKQKMFLRQVSSFLEVDTLLLSNIERGVRSLNRDQVIRLAEILKIDEQELLSTWLCDKVLNLVDKEYCGKSALTKALKHIKKEHTN